MKCFLSRAVYSILLCFVAFELRAQQVDTIGVFSPSMNKTVKNVVILPAVYDKSESLPVLYLLHGYSKDYRAWLDIQPELPQLANRYEMIIVCPDGENSWYWDSPVNSQVRYETYISKELVGYMDSHYKTIPDKRGRAISGFSMGGHGAFWIAIRHQDLFGACGSTSGGVDIRPFAEHWEMKEQLGDYYTNSERWDAYTVMNQLHLIKPGLAIIFDCGTEDFFHEANERLHRELSYRYIEHDYISRPGIHDYAYWRKSITYHLQFFRDYFECNDTYEIELNY